MVLTSTSTTAVSSNTGFTSPLIILVEYSGLPSLEYVNVKYGSTIHNTSYFTISIL